MATANRWAGRVRTLGTDTLGVIVLMTPLAMWVSWTEVMLVAVAGIGVIAGALYCALDRYEAAVGSGGRPVPATGTIGNLNAGMLAELSNLNPMVYHNRRSIERRLQSALDRVKRALEEKE